MTDYPFEIRVLIYQRPNLRDPALEFESQMGFGVLESLFDKMQMRPDIEELFFSFPERWMNILEQRQLYERLQKYCLNLKKVTIKTHSVYIIQCTPNTCCLMVDAHKPPITDRDEGQLHHGIPAGNIFNIDGLTAVGGTIDLDFREGDPA